MKKIILVITPVLLVSCTNTEKQLKEALELKTHRVVEVLEYKEDKQFETDSTYTILARYRTGDYIDVDAVTFYK